MRRARRLTPRGRALGLPDRAVLRSLAIASRVVPSTCLPRAIALQRMLVRRGNDARLTIGLSRSNPPRGHAWVSVGGEVLLDAPKVAQDFGLVLRDETLDVYPFLSATRIAFSQDQGWRPTC